MTDQASIESDGLNTLIKNFLVELKNDAHRKGSKMEFVYSNALKSLRAHPDKIRTVQECIKLKYIGDKTCSILRKKLIEYCQKNSIELPASATAGPENEVNQPEPMQVDVADNQMSQGENPTSQAPAKKAKSKRPYVPKYQSPAFAILIALYRLELDENNYSVSKIDLSKQAEQYLANNGDSSQLSNMWSAMKTLIERELVSVEKSRCNYYTLTDQGRELSAKMYSAMAEKLNLPVSSAANDDNEEHAEAAEEAGLDERLVYLPGTYEIVLIIDSREQYSGVTLENKKTKLVADLQSMGTNCEMRTLPVGDFAWFVKPNTAKRELVLDFLIERKRTDDLIASIRDQRWGEQKYRLKRCGIPNIIYLIEGMCSIKSDHPSYKSLHTALSNAQLIDEFTVKHTKDFKDTLSYLTLMTRYLQKYYANKTLFSTSKKDKQDYPLRENHFLTVNEFSCESQKMTNFTAKEMFVRSLLRFHGATLEKCKAITNVYPTLASLMSAYDECESVKAKEQLLTSITFGLEEKKINGTLSKMIYQYLTYAGDS